MLAPVLGGYMPKKNKKTLLQEPEIQELLGFLQSYRKFEKAGLIKDLFVQVSELEEKLRQVTEELTVVKGQLDDIKEWNDNKPLQNGMTKAADKLLEGYQQIKEEVTLIRNEIKSKAARIVQEIKEKGEVGLYRMAEFIGVKKKLTAVKEKIEQNIIVIDRAMEKIDISGVRIRQAANYVRNAGRVLAGKESLEVKEKGKIGFEDVLKARWKASRKRNVGMLKKVEGVIASLDSLADRVKERDSQQIEAKDKQVSYQTEIQEFVVKQAKDGVVYECGGDAFEAFMEQKKDNGGQNNIDELIKEVSMER